MFFKPKLRLSTFLCVHYPLLSVPVQSYSILPHPTVLLCVFHLLHIPFGSESILLRGNLFPDFLFTSSKHRFSLPLLLTFTYYQNVINILNRMIELQQFSPHSYRRHSNHCVRTWYRERKFGCQSDSP
jgi:hypothetical protein